jgi:hypothetical protein
MSCVACHSNYQVLTEYGRDFKLNGYTASSGENLLPPLAVMLQPSFTQTNKGQFGGAAPHFGPNSNVAITQASVFYAGTLFGPYADKLFGPSIGSFFDKIGVFSQATYDGVARQIHWDNTEFRYADTTSIRDMPLAYGIYANNNPTMEDLWNTLPAWGYPFSSSGLAPTPAASPLLSSLAGEVYGIGAYGELDRDYYAAFALYHTLSHSFQRAVGIDPTGEPEINDVAPYWRAAYTKAWTNQNFEAGLFGLYGDTYPGRVRTNGRDHTLDLGFDSEYQIHCDKSDFTGLFSSIYEHDDWHASQPLGNVSNDTDYLFSTRATAQYLFDKTYGLSVSYFVDNGKRDPTLYADSKTGSPYTDGIDLELDYLPFNKIAGPETWYANVRYSLQYIIYDRFNGGRSNYDGLGTGASDNNTLYLEAWIAF